MTDEELRQGLIEADNLLGEYIRIVTPLLSGLSERHIQVVGGKYEGKLGCFDTGIECICMHSIDTRTGQNKEKQILSYENGCKLSDKFFAGLKHLVLTEYF